MARDIGKVTFVAGEALAKNRLVKLDGTDNQVIYADDGDEAIGVTEHSVAEAGEHVTVRTFTHTFEVVASAAIALGDRLHTEDDGQVRTALAGEESPLVALQAATTAGDLIEAAYVPTQGETPALVRIEDDTDTVAVTAGQMGAVHTVLDLGVAGTAALAIPGATEVLGRLLTLEKTGSAGAITVTPATGDIAGGGTHAAVDAQYDNVTYLATQAGWVIVYSTIA